MLLRGVNADINYPHYCRFCLWKSRPATARNTQMQWRVGRMRTERVRGLRDDERAKRLADTRPSRAVSRNRNIGTTSVFGVRPDRFDHQVESIDTVDFARYLGTRQE
jgi:hypothetical protein